MRVTIIAATGVKRSKIAAIDGIGLPFRRSKKVSLVPGDGASKVPEAYAWNKCNLFQIFVG